MTHANPDVLAFYKELPFNFGDSLTDHVSRIQNSRLIQDYPVLGDLLPKRPRVLEVGCGVGWLSSSIAHHWKCETTAIDFNPVVIERARDIARHMKLGVKFEVADLFTYEPEQPADLVISMGVLHHTNDCAEAVRRCMTRFTAPGGHFFVGLYHTHGRRPFLEHFERMKAAGATESEMLREYGRLHHWIKDKRHLYSWDRDQVIHPHETQHTLAEINAIAEDCGFRLKSTSINRFAPIGDLDDVLRLEPSYEDLARQRLAEGTYFPGFFVALFEGRRQL